MEPPDVTEHLTGNRKIMLRGQKYYFLGFEWNDRSEMRAQCVTTALQTLVIFCSGIGYFFTYVNMGASKIKIDLDL